MFELKPLSRDGIDHAIVRAERYRLLNEAREAESICRDVLEIDPENQRALVILILAVSDQFARDSGPRDNVARSLLERLGSEYERVYYAGVISERGAKAALLRGNPGSGYLAYDRLLEAMKCYEAAEKIRPAGNEDAILRWNTCARLINSNPNIREAPDDDFRPLLE